VVRPHFPYQTAATREAPAAVWRRAGLFDDFIHLSRR